MAKAYRPLCNANIPEITRQLIRHFMTYLGTFPLRKLWYEMTIQNYSEMKYVCEGKFIQNCTLMVAYKLRSQLALTHEKLLLQAHFIISHVSYEPATWRVQFEIFLPFIIRVIERINFVTRLPWHAVVITLLFKKEEKREFENKREKRYPQSKLTAFHTWYNSLICSMELSNFSRDHTVVRPFFVLFKRIFISDCWYSKTQNVMQRFKLKCALQK